MIKGLILSIQFFTRIPIPMNIDFDKKTLKYALFFLPIVGVLVGGVSAAVYFIIAPYNKLLAAVFTSFILVLLTGAIHLDGLADMADGFFCSKEKERVLIIMKDSSIGAFGTLALIFYVMFMIAIIYALKNPIVPLILSGFISRASVIIQWLFFPSAVKEGLGARFKDSYSKPLSFLLLLILIGITAMINYNYLVIIAACFVFSAIMGKIALNKIGGTTGDIYGATIEISNLLSMMLFFVLEILNK